MDAARSQIVGVLPREPHIQGKGSWLFASSLLEDLFQSTSVTPNKMPLASVLGTGHLPFLAFISEVTETPHHYLIFCPDHSPPLGGGGGGGSYLLWHLLLACTRGACNRCSAEVTDTAEQATDPTSLCSMPEKNGNCVGSS